LAKIYRDSKSDANQRDYEQVKYNFILILTPEKADQLSRIHSFFADPDYYRSLVRLALPIALQSLISSSLNFVSVFMIGQLGEVPIASIGLANQVWFLLNLMVFGISSGTSMFVAQLWGKNDVSNIKRVVGLTVKLGVAAALLFFTIAFFFPQTALRLYTNDPVVIATGSRFLRIMAWSYGFYAMTAIFSMSLRAVGNVKLPVLVSTSALVLNILLAYPLIFGVNSLGIPALGTDGAAIAGLTARVLECVVLLAIIFRNRANPVAVSAHDVLVFDWVFIRRVMKPVLPVIGNELLWSMGITTYNAILRACRDQRPRGNQHCIFDRKYRLRAFPGHWQRHGDHGGKLDRAGQHRKSLHLRWTVACHPDELCFRHRDAGHADCARCAAVLPRRSGGHRVCPQEFDRAGARIDDPCR
jgi:hypothetical protein